MVQGDLDYATSLCGRASASNALMFVGVDDLDMRVVEKHLR
jgi:hypothetical protein